jgi:hypothetical protein
MRTFFETRDAKFTLHLNHNNRPKAHAEKLLIATRGAAADVVGTRFARAAMLHPLMAVALARGVT